MTKDEKNAREIISSAMKLNFTVLEAKSLFVSLGNTEPCLTDKECRSIAVNYPYSWESVRQGFGHK